MDITDLSPSLREALLAEIAKELPRLLKRAKQALQPRPVKGRRRRLPHGVVEAAIFKVLWGYADQGASRDQIMKEAARHLGGKPLNENTLKRWLVILKQNGKVEKRNDRWFPLGGSMPGRVKMSVYKDKEPFDYPVVPKMVPVARKEP